MDINRGLYPAPNGGFQSANPAAGVANGSEVTAEFIDDVYFELINIITEAQGTPGAGNQTQIIQSLKRFFGGNTTILSSPQTLTADNLGLIQLSGTETFPTVLPSPTSSTTPLIVVFNNSSVVQNLEIATGLFAGPGGTNSTFMSVAPGTLTLMRSDTASYIVQQQFAAMNGSYSQAFAVAPATNAGQAAQWQQVPGGAGVAINDVTASRALSVIYTNSSDRGIFVSVMGTSNGSGNNLVIYVGGYQIMGFGETSTGSAISVFAFVPAGVTYEVTGPSFTKWVEVV